MGSYRTRVALTPPCPPAHARATARRRPQRARHANRIRASVPRTAAQSRAARRMPAALESVRALGSLLKDAGARWQGDACYRLGASLAYYALFSLFPLALLSLTAVGFVLGSDADVRQKLITYVGGAASPETRAILDQTLQSMQLHRTARGVGALVGAVTLLLGASGVFSELQASLNFIWRAQSTKQSGLWSSILVTLRAKAFSFAVVVVAATALLASLVVGTALTSAALPATSFAGGDLWRILEATGSLGFVALLLMAVYRMVPQAPVGWRDVLGAGLLTSLLLWILKWLLAWYLAHLTSYAAYGAVGGVLGLMTWIYLASLVLFYGAEFGRVYAERFGSLRGSMQSR